MFAAAKSAGKTKTSKSSSFKKKSSNTNVSVKKGRSLSKKNARKETEAEANSKSGSEVVKSTSGESKKVSKSNSTSFNFEAISSLKKSDSKGNVVIEKPTPQMGKRKETPKETNGTQPQQASNEKPMKIDFALKPKGNAFKFSGLQLDFELGKKSTYTSVSTYTKVGSALYYAEKYDIARRYYSCAIKEVQGKISTEGPINFPVFAVMKQERKNLANLISYRFLCSLKLNDMEEANKDINEALKIDPENFTALFYLSQMQSKSNNVVTAVSTLKKAIQLMNRSILYRKSDSIIPLKLFFEIYENFLKMRSHKIRHFIRLYGFLSVFLVGLQKEVLENQKKEFISDTDNTIGSIDNNNNNRNKSLTQFKCVLSNWPHLRNALLDLEKYERITARPGDIFHLIPIKYYRRFKQLLNYDDKIPFVRNWLLGDYETLFSKHTESDTNTNTNNNNNDDKQKNGDHFECLPVVPRSLIVGSIIDPQKKRLRLDLVEGKDYVLVPQKVFEMLRIISGNELNGNNDNTDKNNENKNSFSGIARTLITTFPDKDKLCGLTLEWELVEITVKFPSNLLELIKFPPAVVVDSIEKNEKSNVSEKSNVVDNNNDAEVPMENNNNDDEYIYIICSRINKLKEVLEFLANNKFHCDEKAIDLYIIRGYENRPLESILEDSELNSPIFSPDILAPYKKTLKLCVKPHIQSNESNVSNNMDLDLEEEDDIKLIRESSIGVQSNENEDLNNNVNSTADSDLSVVKKNENNTETAITTPTTIDNNKNNKNNNSKNKNTLSLQNQSCCISCGATDQMKNHQPLKKCTGCRRAHYCDIDCRKTHWPYHKKRCGGNYQSLEGQRLGVVGLKNEQNTCFVNAVVQALSRSFEFTRQLLLRKYKVNKANSAGTKGDVTDALSSVFRDMWYGSDPIVDLTYFYGAVKKYLPFFHFGSGEMHDAHELLAHLITKVHEDLKHNLPFDDNKSILDNVNDNDGTKKQSTSGFNKVLENERAEGDIAWLKYIHKNHSPISFYFGGQFQSTLTCPECGNRSLTYEPFITQSVPIPFFYKRLKIRYMPEGFPRSRSIVVYELEVFPAANMLQVFRF